MTADGLDRLTVERLVRAPVEVVWEAWTTASGLASWWWSGWDDTTYEVAAHAGGTYRITVPSIGIGVSGEFLSVEPPYHLRMTWIWEDADGAGPTEEVTIDLAEHHEGTAVTVRHTGPWTTAEPAAAYRQGWNDVLVSLSDSV